jgi:hypothetical protein
MFKVASLILIHSYNFIVYNAIYRISQHPKTLIHWPILDYNPNSLIEIRKIWVETPYTTKPPKEKNTPSKGKTMSKKLVRIQTIRE